MLHDVIKLKPNLDMLASLFAPSLSCRLLVAREERIKLVEPRVAATQEESLFRC